MNEVVFIPDHVSRGFLAPLPQILNECQSRFLFVVSRDIARSERRDLLEVREALDDAYARKVSLALGDTDLLLVFRDRPLASKEHGMTNLFMVSSNLSDLPPRVGVISTSFIIRGILASDPMYLTQRHALYHLIVCGLLGSFLNMEAHADCGCLLDFNNFTPDIKRKIDTGYAFCESCATEVEGHDLGEAISQVCANLKARGSLDVAGIRTLPKLDFQSMNIAGEQSKAEAFEALIAQLYARRGETGDVTRLRAPDGGIDVLVKRSERILGLQCKFFVGTFGNTQMQQIQKSYDSAKKNYPDVDEFVLVVPRAFTMKQRNEVLSLALGQSLPITIVDRDNLLSLVSREPDLAQRFFG